MLCLIKSISYDQEEILDWILQLYIPARQFDCDPTYSKGVFYKSGNIAKPCLCYDLYPQDPDVVQADCRALPLKDASLNSLIVDLPFLATTGPSLKKAEGNIINRRFGVYPSEKALSELYQQTIVESWRLLKPGGVLVMKCQDKVSSGKQYMMHCDVHKWACEQGFGVLDFFILIAHSRLVANWQRNQKHARKYHSYFWVFNKPKSRIKR